MLNLALATIHDEHRSLAAIVHGLKYIIREVREKGIAPDFKLIWAMIYYIDAFPEKLHHPKENVYLFAKLRQRTHEADTVLDELERQHTEGSRHVRELEHALGYYEADKPDGFEVFAAAVEKFAELTWEHMNLEEKMIIPLAKKYLTPEDWIEIAEAFGENGDPRFGAEPDHEFRNLFSRIVNLAPPPIGVGPAK
ncbi:MAG: hemerythrin domain-containing protein [Sterolibacteriaceae bacterium MAG5]|nr:hemerythrin domain-containing protein [Candidatus Nitricoxidireducens bremensis]